MAYTGDLENVVMVVQKPGEACPGKAADIGYQEDPCRWTPLLDPPPQGDQQSLARPASRAPQPEAEPEVILEIAARLRNIGDQMNNNALQMNAVIADAWQDWQQAWRGLLHLVAGVLDPRYALV